jgi:hypothetical protein
MTWTVSWGTADHVGPLAARRAHVVASLLVASLMLCGACTTARNDLGTTSSQCYRAIPVANAAVHGRGTYSGTVLVSVNELRNSGPLRYLAGSAGPSVQALCLVAYQGTYGPADVTDAEGPVLARGKGDYAVVVVSSPGNELVGTGIFHTEPIRLHHPHAGI